MSKPSVFQSDCYESLSVRIQNLQPSASRCWGKMDPAQMLAHVNIPLEVGLGKVQLPAEFPWPLNVLVKWVILRKPTFRPNMPTAKTFVVADHREFKIEQARLLANLEAFYHRGRLGGPWAKHNIFGALSNEQWGTLTYMHLDHHLRQFGA